MTLSYQWFFWAYRPRRCLRSNPRRSGRYHCWRRLLTILLIEDNPGDAELVEQMLSETGGRFSVQWVASLAAGLDRLADGGIDLILLDLSLPEAQGLETFLRVRNTAPELPIIALTGLNDEALALEAVQQGAQDYLVKGRIDGEALARALRYAVARHTARPGARTGTATVVGVLGAKGGVGVTTIACHLALELRRLTRTSVLLAELDLNGGSAGVYLKMDSSLSIVDVARHVHRLDLNIWRGAVAAHPSGLDVLPGPSCPPRSDPPRPERFRNLLRYARAQYRWVVADLGRLTPLSLRLLEEIDELYLIAIFEVPALHRARDVLAAVVEAGFARDRIRLVLNQTAKLPPSALEELAGTLGLPVRARLPSGPVELQDACTRGAGLSQASNLGQHMARLAGKAAGMELSEILSAGWRGVMTPVAAGQNER